jgi:hypothetical protein
MKHGTTTNWRVCERERERERQTERMYMCINTHMCMHACVRTHAHARTYARARTHTHTYGKYQNKNSDFNVEKAHEKHMLLLDSSLLMTVYFSNEKGQGYTSQCSTQNFQRQPFRFNKLT